jgi:hypothetical protein
MKDVALAQDKDIIEKASRLVDKHEPEKRLIIHEHYVLAQTFVVRI